MADLSTPSLVDAELAATCDYDTTLSLDKARRRVAALRRKLDFAVSSARDGMSLQFQQQIIQDQLNQALAFVRANETPTSAQLLANPSVLHADFGTFGQYTEGDR